MIKKMVLGSHVRTLFGGMQHICCPSGQKTPHWRLTRAVFKRWDDLSKVIVCIQVTVKYNFLVCIKYQLAGKLHVLNFGVKWFNGTSSAHSILRDSYWVHIRIQVLFSCRMYIVVATQFIEVYIIICLFIKFSLVVIQTNF